MEICNHRWIYDELQNYRQCHNCKQKQALEKSGDYSKWVNIEDVSCKYCNGEGIIIYAWKEKKCSQCQGTGKEYYIDLNLIP